MRTRLKIARLGRNFAMAGFALVLAGQSWAAADATNSQSLFESPDQAVTALREAARNHDTNALDLIFEPGASETAGATSTTF